MKQNTKQAQDYIHKILSQNAIIPVMVIEQARDAEPLAKSLIAGGLNVLEITLRTAQSLEAIRIISQLDENIHIGAGTLLTPEDIYQAKDAGASFGVSPGSTGALIDAAIDAQFPLLPGVATISDIMQLLPRSYSIMKLFPASILGGVSLLKSIYGPLPQVSFCPTGGITEDTARQYLACPNVMAVGGSWIASPALVEEKNWKEIENLARRAAHYT